MVEEADHDGEQRAWVEKNETKLSKALPSLPNLRTRGEGISLLGMHFSSDLERYICDSAHIQVPSTKQNVDVHTHLPFPSHTYSTRHSSAVSLAALREHGTVIGSILQHVSLARLWGEKRGHKRRDSRWHQTCLPVEQVQKQAKKNNNKKKTGIDPRKDPQPIGRADRRRRNCTLLLPPV